MNSKRQVNTIKTVLERKWKSIKYTFYYTERAGLPILFSDFQQYLKNTTELEGVVKQLSKTNIIPDNFFKRDFNIIIKKEELFTSSPQKDDLDLIGRIYNGILNEIDMQILHPENNVEINKKEIKINSFPEKDTGNKIPLDIKNKEKRYLDEKELFILYSLLKKKHISSWNNVFVPNNTKEIHINNTGNKKENEENLEQQINSDFLKTHSKYKSPFIMSYLLELGKELDEKNFSIYCNADYSLLEGGFLTEDMREIMVNYLEDTDPNKKDHEKYKVLSKEQIDFLNKPPKKEYDLSYNMKLTELANPPVKEYQEAILNKKADKDFIELINKLITKEDGGKWDKNNVIKFLEIWYRHNKEEFRKNGLTPKTWLYEDCQKKLANLIFEHIDIHLFIKDTKKLEQYLLEYIKLFKEDKLNGFSKYGLTKKFFSAYNLAIPLNTNFFGFIRQKDILLGHIEITYLKFKRNDLEIGSPYVKPKYIGNTKNNEFEITIDNEDGELFLFVHTMIALEYEKHFKIEDFSYGTTTMFDLYDRGFLFKIRLINNKNDTTEQKLSREFIGQEKRLENKFQTNIKKEPNHKSYTRTASCIEKIEIIKGTGRLEVYINENYNNKLDFSRKKYWSKMYDLAENKFIDHDKGFLDYFNSGKNNPLYSKKYGFIKTKILKQEDRTIVPNIEINIITKNKVARRLKNA